MVTFGVLICQVVNDQRGWRFRTRLMEDFIQQLLCPEGFRLEEWEYDCRADHLWLSVKCEHRLGICPDCQVPTRRIYSHYERLAADQPLGDCRVTLRLRVRKFLCREKACSRKLFTERLAQLIRPWARRTQRLAERQTLIGLACGGQPGARLSQCLAVPISRPSLLRLVRQQPLPVTDELRVVGIDDWAICRGQHYGTIVVDLESHQPVALFAGRDAETVADWLAQYPTIDVVSRDRAGGYAEGAEKGAPQSIQVADRFHLLSNLSDLLKRLFNHHRQAIQTISLAVDQIDPAPVVIKPITPPEESSSQPVPASHHRRQARHERVVELHRLGWQQKTIADELGVSAKTVQRYLQWSELPSWQPRQRTRSVLDPYKAYLKQRWQEGCHNATRLFQEIQQQGYRGSRTTVADFIRPWRQSSTATTTSNTRLKPTAAVWLVLGQPSRRDADDERQIEALRQLNPTLDQAIELTQSFAQMVRGHQHGKLNRWLKQAQDSGIDAFRRFAAGIERDYDAVKAALSTRWSNGPVEGHINRLKMLKRTMFGRAKLDLLARRFLLDI